MLFNELDVDAYFLEYDDERSGDFAPLRFVPADKTVVLGIVTSKTAALEDEDLLRARVDEAAEYVDLIGCASARNAASAARSTAT